MTTHLFPISAYPPVQQDPTAPKSSDKWTLAIPLGILGVTFLFMLYRMLFSEESSPPASSFDGKVVSKEAPIEPEKVLCIIRIFRAALEKNPGYDPIPVQVTMTAEKRGQRLDLREGIALPQGEEYVDIASLLPIDQKVWVEIDCKRVRMYQSLHVRSDPTLYQIKKEPTRIERIQINPLKKDTFTVPDYQSNTEYIPLPSFDTHPPIALPQEQQGLQKKKLVISNSQQITLDEEYKGDPMTLENHSDRSVVVQVEVKHGTDESFLLSYSVKPYIFRKVHSNLSTYVNKHPKTIVPLEQIIKDYQAAHKIKHRKELPSPKTEDFSIISIKGASYQE